LARAHPQHTRACDDGGRPWQNWLWRPANTARCGDVAALVRGVDVCEALGTSSVLLVGDSLTYQM